MTYNVFVGTLNRALSLSMALRCGAAFQCGIDGLYCLSTACYSSVPFLVYTVISLCNRFSEQFTLPSICVHMYPVNADNQCCVYVGLVFMSSPEAF